MKRKLTALIVTLLMGALIMGAVHAQEETPETPMPEETMEADDMDMDTEGDMASEVITLGEVNDDPEFYYGQTVSVQDDIVEALAPRIFVMEQSELLSSERLLVVYNTDSIEGFDIVQIANNDLEARVTGTLQQFILGEVHEQYTPELDFGLFQETFEDYDGNAVLIADSVEIVEEIEADEIDDVDIHDVVGDPVALIDQEVTLEEQLVEFLAPNIYRLQDKDFFNPAEVLVIFSGDDTINGVAVQELVEEDPEVVVTGVVRQFDLLGMEEEFGVDFDDEVYEGYEGPVIIASSIVLNEDLDMDGVDTEADDEMDMDGTEDVDVDAVDGETTDIVPTATP